MDNTNIKVVKKKLGRQKVYGYAYPHLNLIELDHSLYGEQYLLYLIHEYLHLLHPAWSEEEVLFNSENISNFLWRQKIRKIEE